MIWRDATHVPCPAKKPRQEWGSDPRRRLKQGGDAAVNQGGDTLNKVESERCNRGRPRLWPRALGGRPAVRSPRRWRHFRASIRSIAISLALTAGAGIGLLPEWLVTEQTRSSALRVVLPAWRSAPVNVYALHRTGNRGTRAVRALLEHLRAGCIGASRGRRFEKKPVSAPSGHGAWTRASRFMRSLTPMLSSERTAALMSRSQGLVSAAGR